MEVTIKGSEKEIAALVVELQRQQKIQVVPKIRIDGEVISENCQSSLTKSSASKRSV